MRKKILSFLIIVAVTTITIGYSAFCSDISLSNIVADIRIEADIRVTAFMYSSATNSGTSSYDEYGVKSLFTNINLPNSNSTLTYKVTVTNFGNAEMGIYELTGLPSNLTYEISDYELQDKICNSSGECTLGAIKTFYLTIKYTSSGYDSSNTEFSLNIGVDFRPFYNITYRDITNNGYPTEIISGGNLVVSFTDSPPTAVWVYVGGVRISSSLYTYENNVLTYENVTDDVIISPPETLLMMMKNSAVLDDFISFGSAPSSTNGQGVYIRSGTENNSFPVYYYRGAVSNNNVLFGNFCWKIVRSTETGGVKLIYNGVPASDGSCNNTGTASQLSSTSAFNSSYTSPAYVGYMYGTIYEYSYRLLSDQSTAYLYGNDVTWDGTNYTLKDTMSSSSWENDYKTIAKKYHYTCFDSDGSCTSVYYIHYFGDSLRPFYLTLTNGKDIEDAKTEMFTNTTNSAIKTAIDTWYESNMTGYTDKLEDTIWCNDRSISYGPLKSKDEDSSSRTYTYFGGYGRLATSPYEPSVTCPNVNDSFTVNSANGNGALTYPVGLLTADELTLAGHGWSGYSSSAYLYTGEYFFSMSPFNFDYNYVRMLGMYSSARLHYGQVYSLRGVRPSVSLVPETQIVGGDGSVSKPFIVSLP